MPVDAEKLVANLPTARLQRSPGELGPQVKSSDARHSDRPFSRLLFAAAVFVSAFLLFQVQPLISKAILPWFGGTPGVWTTCMLFFQVVLFGGYAYAHLLTSYLPNRRQSLVHLVLLVIAIITLRILPTPDWKPVGSESPELRILMLLLVSVGLPYFVISATGPLLQRWFAQSHPGSSPYRLYALSNCGSLLALLSYPFVVEPALGVSAQAAAWSMGFMLFAILCGACALLPRRRNMESTDSSQTASAAVSGSQRALWFLLPCLASVILLAVTNQVCQDVAVIPFLWVAPLSLYLLSFILTFDSDRWYTRRLFAAGTLLGVAGVCCLLVNAARTPVLIQVGIYFTLLFCACMLCHGELARRRPSASHLTSFYLTISAGGAAGGLLTGLLAPAIFPHFWELHLGLLACAATGLWTLRDASSSIAETISPADTAFGSTLEKQTAHSARFWNTASVVVLLLIGLVLFRSATSILDSVACSRNFYGTLTVEHNPANNSQVLRHGRIIHGLQYLEDHQRGLPTTYYGPDSGLGLSLKKLRSTGKPLYVGGVGLGVGTLAAWGSAGDRLRFYEINDDVVRLAQQHFTFLVDTPAACETVLGDARLSLEMESDQKFDLLVLDAFSGDAVPTHLLTEDALRVWLRHLARDGVLAIHISNLHFDLRPVVEGLADAAGLHCVTIHHGVKGTDESGQCSSKWTLLSRDPAAISSPEILNAAAPPQPQRVLWTDQFSNLLGVLR